MDSMGTGLTRDEIEYEVADNLLSHDRLLDPSTQGRNRRNRASIIANLKGFALPTINLVVELTNGEDAPLIFDLLAYNHPEEELLHDWSALRRVATDRNMNEAEYFRYLQSFYLYEGIEPVVAGIYPARRFQQTAALMRAAKHLQGKGLTVTAKSPRYDDVPVPLIYPEELYEVIIDSPNSERVADIIVERDIYLASQIRSVIEEMETNAATLAEGTL